MCTMANYNQSAEENIAHWRTLSGINRDPCTEQLWILSVTNLGSTAMWLEDV